MMAEGIREVGTAAAAPTTPTPVAKPPDHLQRPCPRPPCYFRHHRRRAAATRSRRSSRLRLLRHGRPSWRLLRVTTAREGASRHATTYLRSDRRGAMVLPPMATPPPVAEAPAVLPPAKAPSKSKNKHKRKRSGKKKSSAPAPEPLSPPAPIAPEPTTVEDVSGRAPSANDLSGSGRKMGAGSSAMPPWLLLSPAWRAALPRRGARGGRPARARRAGERGGRGEEGGTLILGDVGRASAFVIATPWKLQANELATVRLFKDNTPSVVYITNLAVRYGPILSLSHPPPSLGASISLALAGA
ncbi:hypothetical protein ZWY2020_015620 [Hordeum vulgare]|nr:hypothetical protein ZWY2020_015620 [Hordeum vulgare]